MKLSILQDEIVHRPLTSKIFLEGIAGVGKTVVGVERMAHLLSRGVPANSILIITPQRSLADPYRAYLRSDRALSGGQVSLVTLGGLSQRMINLFWPMVAHQAGFISPNEPPTFLNLETAQYYMAYLVRPLFQEGFFNSIVIDRNRLYSQILDNLNKSAFVGFPYLEIGQRLKDAWTGEPAQLHVYDDTQTCAARFRQFCLANNLLDFSLQIEVFVNYLWPLEHCFNYLTHSYRHIIIDNVEEDFPVAHDVMLEWLPGCDSALVICDHNAGYRRFLGADPQSAVRLKQVCTESYLLQDSYVTSPEIAQLNTILSNQLIHKPAPAPTSSCLAAFGYTSHHFYPQMLDWLAGEISDLVKAGVAPGEIAVLAPFLSDSLRFAIATRLEKHDIPIHSHRPSRSLRDEPATQCLFTLSVIAHPEWELLRTKFDMAYALVQAIEGLDLVRAQLLTEIIYRTRDGRPSLLSFEDISPDMQQRLTYRIGERYEVLKNWLMAYRDGPRIEPDHFICRLFGEVLSQPGYGFHTHYDSGRITAALVESIKIFRQTVGSHLSRVNIPLGREYWLMLQDGLLAASYLQQWQSIPTNAVLLMPAHTFLMSNHPVSIQFWLDIGGRSWAERLNQPLTHPYVLSRQWDRAQPWTDNDEVEADRNHLIQIVSGLLSRCRQKVYLGLSEFNEQGYEQRGPLLRAFNHVLQGLAN